MQVNDILLYIVYAVIIAAFVFMYFRLRPITRRSLRQKLVLTPDRYFVDAVKIAVQHGEINSRLLARRLKLNKSEAEQLIAELRAKHVVAPANERGVSEVIA